jgi:cytochrome c oxidase subunit III
VSLPVAYAALITAVVVWLLLVRKLSAKSWETQPAGAAEVSGNRFPPARVGLWVFLAVITSLFGLFVSAYYMRMGGHGAGGETVVQDWAPLPDPPVLWLNTAILIAASVAMQMARSAVVRGQPQRTWTSLLLGGLLTLLFLAGQFHAWRILSHADFFTPRNPAIAFFYLLTAVHGAHLLGGLFVWGRTMNRMRSKEVELIDVKLSVELCSVYWHYLLLVWLGLFAMLLST